MNQPISMNILKKIKKIITMEFLDDILQRRGNIFTISANKADMFLYNWDNIVFWSPPELIEIKPRWVWAMIVRELVIDRIIKERRRNLRMDSAMAIGLVTGLLGYTTLLSDPTWVMEALRMELLAKKGVKKELTWSFLYISFLVVTGSLRDISSPLQMHEEMYLLAHRYFIRGYFEDIPRCNYLIDRCLEIAPEWKPAMTLKRRMKYATMKAYIGETVFPYAVGGIFAVSVIRLAGL